MAPPLLERTGLGKAVGGPGLGSAGVGCICTSVGARSGRGSPAERGQAMPRPASVPAAALAWGVRG